MAAAVSAGASDVVLSTEVSDSGSASHIWPAARRNLGPESKNRTQLHIDHVFESVSVCDFNKTLEMGEED